jgi:hypothetical protein
MNLISVAAILILNFAFTVLCSYVKMSIDCIMVNIKIKLSLCFNWAPCHKGISGEWRYSSTHSLTSALDGGEWSASHPSCFTTRERAPGTHWIGGHVGPRAILDAVVKRKIPSPCWESRPRTPIIQPVAWHYTDWAITALRLHNEKFHNLYASPNIIRVMKLRGIRWVGHVAHMGDEKCI